MQTIWITGAATGIGLAIAQRLVLERHTLVLSSRNEDALKRAAHELRALTNVQSAIHVVPCDVTSAVSVESAARYIHTECSTNGAVDVLINNAGVGVFKSLATIAIEDFDNMLNVNLRGAFLCIKAVLPPMIERHSGTIVNINSVAATTVFTNSTGYAASKAGLLALSRSLRQEVRSQGVRVIDVLPGATETGIWSETSRQQFRERMMQPEDVADAVAALLALSPRAMPEEIVLRPQLGDL